MNVGRPSDQHVYTLLSRGGDLPDAGSGSVHLAMEGGSCRKALIKSLKLIMPMWGGPSGCLPVAPMHSGLCLSIMLWAAVQLIF